MKSNIQWDEDNGEGLLQWTSGSTPTLRMGYNPDGDKYTIGGAVDGSATPINTFEIAGFTHVKGSTKSTGSFSRLDVSTSRGGPPTKYWIPFTLQSRFYDAANNQQFIPMFGFEQETPTFSLRHHTFISPYHMKVLDASIVSGTTPEQTFLNMYNFDDSTSAPTLGGGGLSEGVACAVFDIDTAHKVETGNFNVPVDGSAPNGLFISKGQKIAFAIDPTDNLNSVAITISFGIASNWDE